MTDGSFHAVALFSGGLDSILAARLIQDQGLRVRCLHFVTPFFGKPAMLEHWRTVYGLDIESIDISADYIRMLKQCPEHGFGKVMNPCVDCKILMMRSARRRMEELGAGFVISGEVLGQRPMSQRRDTLNIIRRDGNVEDILLRPLCAQHLPPVAAEKSGLVDRSRLPGFFGRGRKGQLELAGQMGITEIPTPAGGCKLAEKENARRYWPVLTRLSSPDANDFSLANTGRQGWSKTLWLSIGRNEADNMTLQALARPDDVLVKVLNLPGPLALARSLGRDIISLSDIGLHRAAAHVATFSPKAVRLGKTVNVRLMRNGISRVVEVVPERTEYFELPAFEDIRTMLRDCKKNNAADIG